MHAPMRNVATFAFQCRCGSSTAEHWCIEHSMSSPAGLLLFAAELIVREGVCFATLCSSPAWWFHTNLVDPASSHMLVSKIKPCMSQYKLLYGKTANGSLKQL